MPLWTFGGAGIDGPSAPRRLVNVSSVTVTQIGGVERCDVRGRTVAFRQLGAGPVVVLVHGLAGTMETWDRVIEDLSSRCTVVAMDLPGHGRSAAPAGDYSLEAYASCVRDLLDALGHRAATVVGHSLGGGVAMQFAYHYPERCERLVLVSSGGLGADVSIALRAAALPGSERVVALIANRYLIAAATIVSRLASAVGIRRGRGPPRVRPGLRNVRRCGEPPFVLPHTAWCHRPSRTARQRHQPPRPDQRDPESAGMGRR